MTRPEWYMALGATVFALGTVRVLLVADDIRRVVAVNVAGAGLLLVLVALASRSGTDSPDAVLHALVLTGIVITISITGLALVLIRHIEARSDESEGEDE